MSEFAHEIHLLHCLFLNAIVFGSAWFFARRRLTTSWSQAFLDAALLGYAIQYFAVGFPGLLGYLNLSTMTAVSMICAVCLITSSWKIQPKRSATLPTADRFIIIGAAIFAVTFILAFAHKQADLPVISNDAMTYHFPAAVQWIQQGRIGLFQTWYFNPANTYSPLAGSTFITWLLLPIGSDVLARFVEVPALFCVGLALYRLNREIGVRAPVAALAAVAAILSRPIFLPCMMAKDDLFVVFFMIAALVALSKSRADERGGPIRFGVAVGLLLATKYTALLSVPILLFAIDGPKWSIKRWCIAGSVIFLLAGPWYLRNEIYFHNPLFPLGSLFTSAHSLVFASIPRAVNTVIGGEYGQPILIAMITLLAMLVCMAWNLTHRNSPLVRACSIGSLSAIVIFFWRSPFPEVRFLLPVFGLLFVCVGFSIERFCINPRIAISIALLVLGSSLVTLFGGFFIRITVPFAIISLITAALGVLAMTWANKSLRRQQIMIGVPTAAIGLFTYINWHAFCDYQQWTRFVDGAGYSIEYPDLTHLWNVVDKNVPPDATLAYTNLYFVYPLQGGGMQRKLVYAPTRRGLTDIADLGWLGHHLAGEQLVPAAIGATVASPDRSVWLSNLAKVQATYLVIGRRELIDTPIEAGFAAADATKFTLLYQGVSGWVYQIN